MKIPETASDITTGWLKNVLPQVCSGCEPVSVEVESNAGGWSLLGQIVRVKLTYATQGCGPPSIIIKFQSQCSDWAREAQIYRLLSEAKVFSVPRLFGVFEHGTLVLEDLSPASPESQVKGCTLQQVQDVLSILAEIHGYFWGDHRVPPVLPDRFASVIDYNMKQCWEPFKSRYRELLNEVASDFEWMWRHSRTVSTHRLSGPFTLFHGDVHAENLLFSKDGTKRPVLLDWQLAGRGLASNDISFFLVKSLTVKQRRANEERLLKSYFELLPERVRAEYEFNRFNLDYRACVTRSMLSAVMLVGPKFIGPAWPA